MSLEAIFRANLNGWLEYENKQAKHLSQQKLQVSDRPLEQLLESLDSTLSYHNYSSEALKALHNTIFHNVIHKQDYTVDFNVVNFPMGLDHYIVYHICERFDLHKYTCYKLWEMPAKDALKFMMQTFSATGKPLRHFHSLFFKLVQKNVQFNGIRDQEVQTFIFEQIEFDDGTDLASRHLPFILQTIYECILDNIDTAKKNPEKANFIQKSTDKLMFFVDAIPRLIMQKSNQPMNAKECSALVKLIFDLRGEPLPPYLEKVPLFSSTFIPIQTCQNSRTQQHDVKYDWHKLMRQQDSDTTTHEQAFLVICWHLQSKCLVLNNMYQNDSHDKSGFGRLEEKMRQKMVKKDVAKCQLWCIFTIRNRASFWKSALKIVVQFMDIWIKDIADTKCVDIFASLIAKENMMEILYNLILKHVQYYQKAKNQESLVAIKASKNLCQMLETCIDNANDADDLILFRNDILKQRLESEDIHLPTFGSIEFWNISFKGDLIKVCNQITAVDDDNLGQYQVSKDVILKLNKLSIVWPYQVIQELFLACVQNKNQFKAIIPILNMLRNLCVFRKSKSCSSLLMSVIQDTVTQLQESGALISHQENIAQFIKGCLMNHFTEIHPIILTPKCLPPDQPTKMLLDLADILNDFILPPLVAFTQHPTTFISAQLVQFNLYLLNSFCQYHLSLSQSSWDDVQTFIDKANLPTVLYCLPETFVHCLTFIMNLREQDEKHGLRLDDWEAALNCINKLTVIIQYGMSTIPSQFRRIQQYFDTTLADFGWKSQLLWYPFVRETPLRVPSACFRITGSLNGLFEAEKDNAIPQNDDKLAGWYNLFTACRLSTDLTEALFRHHAQWQYNLLLLWKHPVENEILQNGLHHALHPRLSNSVSIEYPKLLNHFLFKLYDSFDSYSVLQEEQYYNNNNILPIVSQLSRDQGTRLYFVVLCIVQLLKSQVATESNDSNSGDLYYMSCLIKVIQDMTHWGDISKDGQTTSYNKLKERLNQDTVGMVNATTHYCFYYPLLNTEKLKSDRALSILTLYHLSSLNVDMNQTQSDVIQRLVMQIIEGLVDMESRQQFERMLQQQPKKRIANWKKKSKSNNNRCKQMRLRPILGDEETRLLRPVIIAQPHNADQLSQVLGLSVNYNVLDDHHKTLYFL